MAEGLKAMALEGHGLAFLPASSVRKELQGAAPGARRRPTGRLRADDGGAHLPRAARGRRAHAKPGAQALWDFLRRLHGSTLRPVAQALGSPRAAFLESPVHLLPVTRFHRSSA